MGGTGPLPDLKHFSELHQLLLMGNDAMLAPSQAPVHLDWLGGSRHCIKNNAELQGVLRNGPGELASRDNEEHMAPVR